jgi:SPP1 family predicted phage head-tail adaptor
MSGPKGTAAGEAFSRFVHRFQLEAPVRQPEPSGGAEVAYAVVAEVWGELRAVSGGEQADADRLAADVGHVIAIRHRDGLTSDHRFRLGQRVFAIRAVLDRDGRRRFLECRCEEVVA